MIYCEGKNCSIRSTCSHHWLPTSEASHVLDYSTTGCGYCRFDFYGNIISQDEYDCGDDAKSYTHYQPTEQATDKQIEALEDDLRDCFTISEICEGYEYIDFTETARKLLQFGYYKIGG